MRLESEPLRTQVEECLPGEPLSRDCDAFSLEFETPRESVPPAPPPGLELVRFPPGRLEIGHVVVALLEIPLLLFFFTLLARDFEASMFEFKASDSDMMPPPPSEVEPLLEFLALRSKIPFLSSETYRVVFRLVQRL